jgi:hypothetical protein
VITDFYSLSSITTEERGKGAHVQSSPHTTIRPLIFVRQLCGKMKFQKLDVYINKCIEWVREKRISLRAVIRGRV